MSKIFLQRGSRFSLVDDNFDKYPVLEKGLYDLRFNMEDGIYLEKTGESFEFNYKLYGLDNTFISHVLNTYKKSKVKKNMGVLLNGERGTGKTVCAKYLARPSPIEKQDGIILSAACASKSADMHLPTANRLS